jgi:hypothetical protein
METQLKYAEEFDWKLMFNGDETERYVPYRDGDIYGGFPALPDWKDEDWSMTSLAACIASLEFYLYYLKEIGDEGRTEIYTLLSGVLTVLKKPYHGLLTMKTTIFTIPCFSYTRNIT